MAEFDRAITSDRLAPSPPTAGGVTDVLTYRNIRYATATRFEAAQVEPLSDVVADRGRGPLPPQLPSRFDILLGAPAPLEQDEHCQVLSVFTPGLTGSRPVMIWFHGGAFITGGGELPWYDGHLLAAEQDVVVVTVTARLGALGHLVLGVDGPSPATSDHLAAVEWVRRHVSAFGGDPDNITLFGQSAGGFAIDAMLRWGLGPHVKGAIVQSGFLSQDDIVVQRQDLQQLRQDFMSILGQDPRTAPVERLLNAQAELAKQVGRTEIWAPIRPETPQPMTIPVMAGVTRHDVLPFLLIADGRSRPEESDFLELSDAIRQQQSELITRGNQDLAARSRGGGQQAWLYEFAWDIPVSGWGAPHCAELPYLLGDRDAWERAPMMHGADWRTVRRRGRHLRSVWASFARHQTPGTGWPAFDDQRREVAVLDEECPTA